MTKPTPTDCRAAAERHESAAVCLRSALLHLRLARVHEQGLFWHRPVRQAVIGVEALVAELEYEIAGLLGKERKRE